MKKRMMNLAELIQIERTILEALRRKSGRKEAVRWYVFMQELNRIFFVRHTTDFLDRMRLHTWP